MTRSSPRPWLRGKAPATPFQTTVVRLTVIQQGVYPWPMLNEENFEQDRHAAGYLPEFLAHPQAFTNLLQILNDPLNERCLIVVSELGHPALCGVVTQIEADAALGEVVPDNLRFRQGV